MLRRTFILLAAGAALAFPAAAAGTGAAAVRAVSLSLTGELKDTKVLLPPTLITRQFLLDNDVKNEEELNAKLPEFRLEGAVTAGWIKPARTN